MSHKVRDKILEDEVHKVEREGQWKSECADKREERDSLDPVLHGEPVLFGRRGGCDYFLGLVEKSLVGAFFKSHNIVRLFSVKAGEWDIVDGSRGVTYTVNFTAATGAEAVMAFDSHDLCDGWHVSKNEEEEGTEEK